MRDTAFTIRHNFNARKQTTSYDKGGKALSDILHKCVFIRMNYTCVQPRPNLFSPSGIPNLITNSITQFAYHASATAFETGTKKKIKTEKIGREGTTAEKAEEGGEIVTKCHNLGSQFQSRHVPCIISQTVGYRLPIGYFPLKGSNHIQKIICVLPFCKLKEEKKSAYVSSVLCKQKRTYNYIHSARSCM